MALRPGAQIGSYEILSPLGEGGMGVVFRARDRKLERDVAIKVLPDAFAADPDRLVRFQREAQVLASLNHPNIAQIYGLEDSGQTRCIVMELIEGDTLADRLKRGPIGPDETVEIAKQILSGLEAAHEIGITHRDLKPANIKFTRGGAIKILDFGLAKIVESAGGPTFSSNSPTLNAGATGSGVILGTLSYMSPEQARGQAVDARTDIWAFGCVLYEMLTGRQTFSGETVSDHVASILKTDPEWNALPKHTPVRLQSIIRDCLQKNARERLHSAADIRIQLKDVHAAPVVREAVPSRGIRAIVLGIAAGLVTAALALFLFGRGSSPPATPLWVAIPPPPAGFSNHPEPAISPDGKLLVFEAPDSQGKIALWLRSLDSPTARLLPDTDGAGLPFWSPDSRNIAFFAKGKLQRIAIAGGSPQTVAKAPSARGAAWNKQGTILYVPVSGEDIDQVSANGGTPAVVVKATAGNNLLRYPYFLPDDRHFLYTLESSDADRSGVYLGSLDGGTPERLVTAVSRATYAAGFLLFVKERGLFAQRFDTSTLKTQGEPFRIAEGVGWAGHTLSDLSFSSSEDAVAYWTGLDAPKSQLQWFSRRGDPLNKIGQPAQDFHLSLSPDDRLALVERMDASKILVDAWIIDLASGISERFSSEGMWVGTPIWSPAGTGELAYSLFQKQLFRIRETRNPQPRDISLDSPGTKWLTDWSSDGRYLLFTQSAGATSNDIWFLDTMNPSKATPLIQSAASETFGQLSPSGDWIAYTSDKTGTMELYVNSFPKVRNDIRISPQRGLWPRWSKAADELFYISPDKCTLMVVRFRQTAESFAADAPQPLFDVPPLCGRFTNLERAPYAVSRDGQRFLFEAPVEDPVTPSLILGFNWHPNTTGR